MKLLVIGGVAAGTKVAAKFKRVDRSAEVTVVTMSRDISYAGCGLPYYVGGAIPSRDQLIVNTPASYAALTGAQVRNEREVVALDPQAKTATARNLRTGETEIYAYDACVVATGASAIVPKIEGATLPGVFTMRTPDDAIDLKKYVEDNQCAHAVVAGGGFIGLEIAENLQQLGLNVTVVDMADQIMPGFDFEMAEFCQRHLQKKGIRVLTATKLQAVTGAERATGIATDKGELRADVVVMSLGIRPNTAFLKDVPGLRFARNGAIVVDEQLGTGVADVYAVGDCAMVKNRITDQAAWSPMGSSANLEGRTLAQVLGGADVRYPGAMGTAVVKLPGLNAARTGLSEAAAREAGYDVETVLCATDDKAHYYPDASFIYIKLIADKTTHRLLGVQALGAGAVDKMVDIGVMAIAMNARVEDFDNMDFAYAPPFSTAIHPMVCAAYMLENKLSGDMVSVTPAQYLRGEAVDYAVIDVNVQPTIPGATFVDLTKVNSPLPGIPQDAKLLLVCRRGKRAYFLQNRLRHLGYANTAVLEGATLFNEVKAAPGKVTIPAEEITRVKALGFLHNKGTNNFSGRVITRNGKITARESQYITDAAEKFGNGNITFTSRLTVEVQGIPFEKIDDFRAYLAEGGLETGGTGSKVRPVVSCKGTTCQYGLIDTFQLSDEIHERFYHGYASVKLPHKFKIAVGGCPNNCVKPDLNDLGVIGQRVPHLDLDKCRGCRKCQVEAACPIHSCAVKDGKLAISEAECNHCGRCVGKCPFHALDDSTYGYRIYIGGRWGKKTARGWVLDKVFTDREEVMLTIEKAILLFREQGVTGERFNDTIARIGFENVQAQLLSDDILQRKEAILGAQVHLKGGATC
ncbi:MAG: FAD-dependent oxidoreductase [Clostridia bacterium]|nr:FAD-dependent oxidoreductase [Clostridia bacterium]